MFLTSLDDTSFIWINNPLFDIINIIMILTKKIISHRNFNFRSVILFIEKY